MSTDDEIKQLLVEIRDNQRLSLQRQEEHLKIAQEQLERAKNQVAESIQLQRQAIARVKTVMRVAIPGIVVCIALIIYLMSTYL